MSMTKQDFQLIAEVIDDMFMGHHDWNRQLDQVASKFAERLATTNPNFDRQRFIDVATGERAR